MDAMFKKENCYLKNNNFVISQVIGMNEYGDGMFSQIVEAKTKGIFSSYSPTKSSENIFCKIWELFVYSVLHKI